MVNPGEPLYGEPRSPLESDVTPAPNVHVTVASSLPAASTVFTHSALAIKLTRSETKHAGCFFSFFVLAKFDEAVTFVRNETEAATRPAAVDARLLRNDGGDRAH